MNGQDVLKSWSQSELAAHDYVEKTAGWLDGFFDPQSKFYHVAFSRTPSEQRNPEPNSASCLIGGIVARTRSLLSEPQIADAVDTLLKNSDLMANAIKAAPISRVLPLRSFGFLPLFSTSYLAEYLPDCYSTGTTGLAANYAYLIVIRRLLVEVIGHSTSIVNRIVPHAFLLLHTLRALKAFQKALQSGPEAAFDDIRHPEKLREKLFADLGEADVTKMSGDFQQKVEGATNSFFDQGLSGLVLECLAILEDLALKAVLTEIANSHRTNPGAVNSAALAFGLLTLAEADNRRYSGIAGQGIELLSRLGADGYFASGKPFFSDDRARSLLVPSVETANALIALTLSPQLSIGEDQFAAVVSTTDDVQRQLMEEHNSVPVGNEIRDGWCSDRVSTPDRIESWATGHALEFFVNRVRLLRATKRKRVFSLYNSGSSEKVKPHWDKLIDPDEGHCENTLKKKINAGIAAKKDGIAPVFLLYGPPGTSKTTIAKSVATKMGERGWDLLLLSPSDFVSESLDKIEYQSRRVFDDLMKIDRCVVIFDEVDALFRNRQELRKKSPGSILEFVVPALLPKLQDFRDYAMTRDIVIMFLTNYFKSIDPAISRGGRIDHHVVVLPYSIQSREQLAVEFYEKAGGSKDSRLEEFTTFLHDLPCNLVYRDIQIVARAAARGTTIEGLGGLVDRLGIRRETYNINDREGAGHEFCMFYSRLIDKKFPATDLTERKQMASFLFEAQQQTPNDRRFEKWKSLADRWQNELNQSE